MPLKDFRKISMSSEELGRRQRWEPLKERESLMVTVILVTAQIFLLRKKLPSNKRLGKKILYFQKDSLNWYRKSKFDLLPMNHISSTMPEAFAYGILFNHCTAPFGYDLHLMRSRDLKKLTKVIY